MIRAAAGGALLAACSHGRESSEPSLFGAIGGACGVTVLTHGVGDEALLREGVVRLLDAVDAQRPFVWDLLVPTIAGDPIRFQGDGQQVTIVSDATRDQFGRKDAVVRTCDSVEDTGFVPIGAGCTTASVPPFTLPESVWPP